MQFFIILLLALVCGTSSFTARGRIFNGLTASNDKCAYHVRVKVPINSTTNTACGGSLLNNTWVLTAAHCFDKGNKFATELQLSVGGKNARLLAKNVYIHEKYVKVTSQTGPINDIALVKIPKIPNNVIPSDIIESIVLPLEQQSIDGQSVIISGWGRTGQNAVGPANQLQYTTIKVLSDSECAKRIKGIQLPSQFCAFKSDSTACMGDSGGPAVLEGSRIQLGILSYVLDPICRAGSPVAMSRISYYLPWIQEKMSLM